MRITKQHKIAAFIVIVCSALMLIAQNIQFGKLISTIIPCTTEVTNATNCYASYDLVLFTILAMVIAICILGPALDFVRKK